MKTENIILLIYCIVAVGLLVYFFGFTKKAHNNPQDDGSYYFGGLVICCAWGLIIWFIPFMLWSDYRQKKKDENDEQDYLRNQKDFYINPE